MRLIDADALKKHSEFIEYKNMWHMTERDEFVSVKNIDSAPTIDAVEVVRCRECKWWRDCSPPENATWCARGSEMRPQESGYIRRFADDFCSYGERRERYEEDEE